MSESTRMMLGLVIGIAIMIVLVMKTKVHTFIALLLAALITGLIGGMPVADITNAAGETTVGVMTAIKVRIWKHIEKYRYHNRTWSYDGWKSWKFQEQRNSLHLLLSV